MQERYRNRTLYFTEQGITTEKYVIPALERFVPLTSSTSVLEVGCGDGGNLRPFLDRGCHVTGIELNPLSVEVAREHLSNHPQGENLTLICDNAFNLSTQSIGRFDIVLMRDVIEHIPAQKELLGFLRSFLKPGSGCLYVAFPPWHNPFGGHQQTVPHRLISRLPYLHLLPLSLYKKVLECSEVYDHELLDMKAYGLSIERFKRLAGQTGYQILSEELYLINPHYEIKFKLHPQRLWPLLNIPYLRNLYTTAAIYLLR